MSPTQAAHPTGVGLLLHRVPDAPVRLTNRELNMQAVSGELPLNIEERDDYGLTALEIFTVRNQEETVLKRIDYRARSRTRTEACIIPITEDLFARNASYKLWARVFDNHQPAQTGTVLTPLTLHVADLAKTLSADDTDDPHARLFAALHRALDRQKSLRDWVAVRIERDRRERISPNPEAPERSMIASCRARLADTCTAARN